MVRTYPEPIPNRPALWQRFGRRNFKSYQQFSQPKTELAPRTDHLSFRDRVAPRRSTDWPDTEARWVSLQMLSLRMPERLGAYLSW